MINAGAIACVIKAKDVTITIGLAERQRDHLNRTQREKEQIPERTVRHKHRQRNDHKHRVQQCALERHCHTPEVKRPLPRPDRLHDSPLVNPEARTYETGRTDVHPGGQGPVTEAGHLHGVVAVDSAGPSEGGTDGGGIKQHGER